MLSRKVKKLAVNKIDLIKYLKKYKITTGNNGN